MSLQQLHTATFICIPAPACCVAVLSVLWQWLSPPWRLYSDIAAVVCSRGEVSTHITILFGVSGHSDVSHAFRLVSYVPVLAINGVSLDPFCKLLLWPVCLQAPMCTVHSFPHNIDHCLTWARSEFEGLLEKGPSEANTFLNNPNKYTGAGPAGCGHGFTGPFAVYLSSSHSSSTVENNRHAAAGFSLAALSAPQCCGSDETYTLHLGSKSLLLVSDSMLTAGSPLTMLHDVCCISGP